MALAHLEARLPLHQGALSRHQEESRVAADRLCTGQSLSTSQAAGLTGGVVCPEAGNGLQRHHKQHGKCPSGSLFSVTNVKSRAYLDSRRCGAFLKGVVQRFPSDRIFRSPPPRRLRLQAHGRLHRPQAVRKVVNPSTTSKCILIAPHPFAPFLAKGWNREANLYSIVGVIRTMSNLAIHLVPPAPTGSVLGCGERLENWALPAAGDPESDANSLAGLYCGIGGTGQRGANGWLQVLTGAGWLCPPASCANRTARRRTCAASRTPRHEV